MKTAKVFDFQSEGGKECCEEAEHLWRHLEYGNDHYYWETTLGELKNFGPVQSRIFVFNNPDGSMIEDEEQRGWREIDIDFKHIPAYIESQGVTDDETILIHWWW